MTGKGCVCCCCVLLLFPACYMAFPFSPAALVGVGNDGGRKLAGDSMARLIARLSSIEITGLCKTFMANRHGV